MSSELIITNGQAYLKLSLVQDATPRVRVVERGVMPRMSSEQSKFISQDISILEHPELFAKLANESGELRGEVLQETASVVIEELRKRTEGDQGMGKMSLQ